MTEREKFYAAERKIEIYHKRHGRCEVCGKPVRLDEAQLAHRIPKHKKYIKKYGKPFMHSDINLALVCSLRCNAAVLCHPATHPIEAERLYQSYCNPNM